MRRREFITFVGGATVGWPLVGHTQQVASPVIGFLDPRTPEVVAARLRGFRQGLKEAGYVDGENVAIVYGWGDDQIDRLPSLAADLVRRPVAAIVASGPTASFAARAATTTIPIVFLVSNDPVQLGLVASLSRPGGNMTGINILNSELASKRLELLRDLLPRVGRIALLVNPADASLSETQVKDVNAAARSIGLKIEVHNADTSAEIDAAFEAMGRDRPDAVIVGTTPFLNGRRVQLAQVAAFNRLPAIYTLRESVEVGGLMSYGSNIVDAYRQVGVYVGRILKGAKPGELPIVQATKFELVINAPTARMLGLTIPTQPRRRGDRLSWQCPLLALSGHRLARCTCLLLTQSGTSRASARIATIGCPEARAPRAHRRDAR
ncbi:MAG: ABC transporter substrate-binding protein [Pseudolabrys sp.]